MDILCKHLLHWDIGNGERFQLTQTPLRRRNNNRLQLSDCIWVHWRHSKANILHNAYIGCSNSKIKPFCIKRLLTFLSICNKHTHTFTFTFNSSILFGCQIAFQSILFFLWQFHFVQSFVKYLPIKGLSELNWNVQTFDSTS